MTPTLVYAQPSEAEQHQAEEHFQQGVALHDEGDYRAALIEFTQAYSLAPTYHLLYNLGQESTALKEYVEAHRYFVQYLADGGDQIDEARRTDVERKIVQLKKYLATIKLNVGITGAEVAIDGIVVGVSPLESAVDVSLGRRKIVVTREGYARWERTIDVAGGNAKTVDVELISLAAMSEPAAAESSTSSAFWVSAGTTGLLLAGTGVAAILTSKAKSDHEADVNTVGDIPPEDKLRAISDSADKYKRMALYTDIGIGLSIVGVATTVWLATRDDKKEEPAMASGLQVQVGLSTIGISGRF